MARSEDYESSGAIVRSLMRLEADRVVAAAAIGREPDASPDDIARIDANMDVLMRGLKHREVGYPPHLLAGRYSLTGEDYVALQVGLMPYHAPDALERLDQLLGYGPGPTDSRIKARLTFVVRLIAPATIDLEQAARQLEQSPVCTHGLIHLARLADGDRELHVSAAVLELLGLSE